MTKQHASNQIAAQATKTISKTTKSRPIKTSPKGNVDIVCFLDVIDGGKLEGWAFDQKNVEQTISVAVYVDGKWEADAECGIGRDDVKEAGFPKSACGFRCQLPRHLLDGNQHSIQIMSGGATIKFMYRGNRVNEAKFSEKMLPILHGAIDGVEHGEIRGWVVREDSVTGELVGRCQLLITCDGVICGNTKADWARSDVASELKCDAACGFRFTPPEQFKSYFPREYRFFVMPERIELPQSPHFTSFVSDHVEGAMRKINTDLARVYGEIGRLRGELLRLLPSDGYSVGQYHLWAVKYFPSLRERVVRARLRGKRKQKPLISIVMPIFRPGLTEFRHAVDSVREQTYQNWQLIMVDDGSNDERLSHLIDEMSKNEPRITIIRRQTNVGISRSTNEALEVALGDWIAFFDHDDVLVDVALEAMVDAAQSQNAQLVYSDEDKIDQAGHYLEPSFKPDWNYRLLLSVNYICHFVMIRRDLVTRVGAFDPRVDGAQDHDFLLRISEILDPRFIYHVPDVLYHWRVSSSSTAGSVAAKPYAVLAGQTAIQDHLRRKNKQADVTPINQKTFFKIKWTLSACPRVTIIVPFKDQSFLTRRCVEALLSLTDYPDFDIILVDNWSTESDTDKLLKRYSRHKKIQIMRVEEEFNYSKLNNFAAASTNAELIVFLNNDVFIQHSEWLSNIVSEAVSDPLVGAVGGKLLYPDLTVQHGGVVTGIGGVAGHAHVGAKFDAPGYGGRLWFAQEMTAVTAACMLVKSSVFREVGGFDEISLKVAFNDVDLCLKIRAAGYRIVWTPELVAEHHESVSRGLDTHKEKEMRFFQEVDVMKIRWKGILEADPFYNKNFSLDGRPFFNLVDPA